MYVNIIAHSATHYSTSYCVCVLPSFFGGGGRALIELVCGRSLLSGHSEVFREDFFLLPLPGVTSCCTHGHIFCLSQFNRLYVYSVCNTDQFRVRMVSASISYLRGHKNTALCTQTLL